MPKRALAARSFALEDQRMLWHEDEALRLPVGTFDVLTNKRRGGLTTIRYRPPNLIERSFGVPIAVAAFFLVAAYTKDPSVGGVAALLTILAFVGMRDGEARQNHNRMWKEVFALRGALAHALSHERGPCGGCGKAQGLIPEWDAEARVGVHESRASGSDGSW